jgi:hypothetical protein
MAQKSRKYLTSSGRCQKRPSVKTLNFALFFSNESLPLPTLVEYYKTLLNNKTQQIEIYLSYIKI